MENGQLRFDDQIKWYKGENTLQWSMFEMDITTGRPIIFIQRQFLVMETQLRMINAEKTYYFSHQRSKDGNNSK